MPRTFIDNEEKDHIKYLPIVNVLKKWKDKTLSVITKMWEHEPVDRILFMVTDNSIPEVRTFDTLEDAVKFYNDTPGGD